MEAHEGRRPDDDEEPEAKKPRTRSELEEQRRERDLIEMELPGYDDVPAMTIHTVRPVVSRDQMAIPFTSDAVGHFVGYLRHRGISFEARRRPRKRDVGAQPEPENDGESENDGDDDGNGGAVLKAAFLLYR